jgi:hypothetical protein
MRMTAIEYPMVSHLTQRQSSLRRFRIMQRRMRRTSESLSFLTVWWCRRLLMQVEETAAEPAETRPAWSAFSILVFVLFRRSEDLFASLCGAVARLARTGAAMTCVARWRL